MKNNFYYDISSFVWNSDINAFFAFEENLLIIPYYSKPFTNKGKQFFILNKKTNDFRRFRLLKEKKDYYHFLSEDEINCIVYKEKYMKSKFNSIELLNFEGPVLKAHKTEDVYEKGRFIFIITDERKCIIDVFDTIRFTDFLMGVFDVKDSMNRIWNYPSQSQEAKQPTDKMHNFIYKFKEDDPRDELIKLLENQIRDLTLMSKIELGNDVISEIQRLKSIINE